MENALLPVTLQILKDEFDQLAIDQQPEPDPEYDFNAVIAELLEQGIASTEILIITCPICARPSYYSGGFTASCDCCGYYNLADYSDDAVTLNDYWMSCFEESF